MADLSDVERAIVAQLAASFMPPGYLSGAIGAGPGGIPVRLYRGWPSGQAGLNSDLAAGRAHVSVYAVQGMSRDTTRYLNAITTVQPGVATITATLLGRSASVAGTITLGGTGGLAANGGGQLVGVVLDWGGSQTGYSYRLTATDTLATAAAGLAAAIPLATALGGVVTLAGLGTPVLAETGADTVAITELAREEQEFRVSIWAPNPRARDTIGGAVKQAMSALRSLALPDGSATGIAKHRATYVNDMPSRDRLWKRDECYMIEYPTTQTVTYPPVLFPGVVLNDGRLADIGPLAPVESLLIDGLDNVLIDVAGVPEGTQ